MPLGPLDLSGGQFLTLYVGLLFSAVLADATISKTFRPRGRRQMVVGADALAVLIGGTTRLAEAVVTRLLMNCSLSITDLALYAPVPGAQGSKAAERNVLGVTAPTDWITIEERIRPEAERIAKRLVADGLLMDARQIRWMRIRQTAPYLLLLYLGFAKLVVGLTRGRPVGYLTLLLLVTVVAAAVRWRATDRRTRGGQVAVRDARARSERLQRAPTLGEADLAVTLFGTPVLAGSGLAAFHQARRSPANGGSSGDGSSGEAGGGTDGGDSGGGCGGCSGD